MRFFAAFLAFAGLAGAVDWEKWHPPAHGDMRSPCPALNSLANHGILPRDGKGYTVPLLVRALGEALNISEEVATTVAEAGLKTSSDPSSHSFTLDDLKKHGFIEHDASLSRKDLNLGGSNQEFCPEIFNEFLSYFNGAKKITIPQAAAARWGRVKTEKGRNQKLTYEGSPRFNSYAESSLYWELLKDAAAGTVSVDWIKIFFSQERLPFREGWRPVNHIDGFSLMTTELALALSTPEKEHL